MHGCTPDDKNNVWLDHSDLEGHNGVERLAELAKELGIQFKIGGFPFGADHETHRATFGLTPLSKVTRTSAMSFRAQH